MDITTIIEAAAALADERHTGMRVERQQAVVFKQDDALCGAAVRGAQEHSRQAVNMVVISRFIYPFPPDYFAASLSAPSRIAYPFPPSFF